MQDFRVWAASDPPAVHIRSTWSGPAGCACEGAPPEFEHTAAECRERRAVCRHGVIGEEASDHLLKPLSLSGYGMVSSPPQLLADFLQFRRSGRVGSSAPAGKPLGGLTQIWVKPRKSKVSGCRPRCSRLRTACRPNSINRVFSGWSASSNPQTFPHHFEEPTSIGLALKSDHQIISPTTRDDHGAEVASRRRQRSAQRSKT